MGNNYKYKSSCDIESFREMQLNMLVKFHNERDKWDDKKIKKWNDKHNEIVLSPDELKQISNIDTSRSHLNKRWDNPNKMIITDEIREQCRKKRNLQKTNKIYTGAIMTFRLEDENGKNKTIKEYSKKDFEDAYKWANEIVEGIKDNPIWADRFQFAELHMDETNPHIQMYFLNYNQNEKGFDTSRFWNVHNHKGKKINPFADIKKEVLKINQKFASSKTNNRYEVIPENAEGQVRYFKSIKQLKMQKKGYKHPKLTKDEIEAKRQFQENCQYNCRIRKENKELREEQKELLKKQESLKNENDNLFQEQQKYIYKFKEQREVLEIENDNLKKENQVLENEKFINKEIIKNQQLEINDNDQLINYVERNEEILNKLSQESKDEYEFIEQQLFNQNNNQGGQNG